MVNRIVVGAHYGLKDWFVQRISAVVMAVYVFLFAVLLLASGPMTYASWKGLFAQGWMRFATLLFVLSVLWHAWIGMRDIFMDYIKPIGLRIAFHIMTVLVLVGCGGWALQILWRS